MYISRGDLHSWSALSKDSECLNAFGLQSYRPGSLGTAAVHPAEMDGDSGTVVVLTSNM